MQKLGFLIVGLIFGSMLLAGCGKSDDTVNAESKPDTTVGSRSSKMAAGAPGGGGSAAPGGVKPTAQ